LFFVAVVKNSDGLSESKCPISNINYFVIYKLLYDLIHIS